MRAMKSIRATLALAVVATLTWTPVAATAATIQVRPGAMNGWLIANEDANNVGSPAAANGVFVAGPGATPAGSGSFRQFAVSGHKSYLHTDQFDGTPLAGLSISFSTYTTDTAPVILTAAINMSVDKDGDQISDTSLVFEPYDAGMGATATAVWQTWNAIENGNWWSTSDGGPGVKKTLAAWNTDFGGTAAIAASNPLAQRAFRIVTGSSGTSWPDVFTNVDNLTVNADTFDFEQDPVSVVEPGDMGDWAVSSTGAASASFVLGPDTPPLGGGSQHQVVTGANGFARATNASLAGTPIAGIDLVYATYVSARPNAANAPSLKLRIDKDGNGTGDETLVFEPYWQNGSSWHVSAPGSPPPAQCVGSPCAKVGEWQTWDAGKGAWWSTSGGTGSEPHLTLASYAKANPGATIATLDPQPFAIETGSSGSTWVGTDAAIDAVTVNGSRFDFEPLLGALDCSAVANDIAQVQSIINSAPNGFVLELSGTCDFSAAAAHGGDQSSLVNTAVLIRPGSPINGLTITSAGAPQSATILGGGDEAAFAVAPGNSNVTIKGLTFRNFARAVVAINSDRTTVGDASGLPSDDANRIVGGVTAREAILGLALDRNPSTATPSGSVILNYGAGAASQATYTGQGTAELSNFEVLGNYISFDPPGTEDGATQIVAIAVRQRYQNRVEGVLIKNNAVGMFATEFPTTNMTAVQVHSFNSVPTTGPSDYLISDVEIDGNNLGRLEQLALDPEEFGVDPADVHAAGRTGIVLIGVSDFDITDNGVRVRESSTGPVPMPGGGIIVSDSGFGRIGPGNSSMVLADPSTAGADLGAFGVVESFAAAFGSPNKAQETTNIVLTGNRIGTASGGLAGRGLVVTAGDKIVAHANNLWNTSQAAVNIGIEIQGPGSLANPGLPVTLETGVTDSVICLNNLDGTVDDDAEVEADDVTSAAFPSGSTVPVNNAECGPTIGLDQTLLNNSSGNLTATGFAWPNRPVQVSLSNGGSVLKNVTAAADGSYSAVFTVAEWTTLNNGTLSAIATAVDMPSGASAASTPATVVKNTNVPVPPTITSPSNVVSDPVAAPPSFTVVGSGPAVSTIKLRSGATLLGQVTSNSTGGWSIALTGQSGTLALQATSVNSAGNESAGSNLVNVTIDASVPAPPVITSPACGSEVNSNNVTLSGTSGANHTIKARRLSPAPPTFLSATTADGSGNWSMNLSLADGFYVIAVRAQNGVGTESSDATCSFQVRTDFAAPGKPVIITPAQNSFQPRLVDVTGTAEAGSTVRIMRGASVLGTTVTGVDGRWAKQIGFTDGTHTITAIAKDNSGNDSVPSDPRTFSVDGIRPRVTITTSELIPQIGDLRVAGTASDNMSVVRVEIEVVDLLFGGETTGNATLASPGSTLTTWTYTAPVSTCLCQVTATSYDAAGNRSAVDAVTIIEVG